MKKLKNTNNRYVFLLSIGSVLVVWQLLVSFAVVPRFMLPSPFDVVAALIGEFPILVLHARTTLFEAFVGLLFGVIIGYGLAIVMDLWDPVYRFLYPLIVVTQTIPTVATAPLLVLWLGYGVLPKITLIVLTSFFPIAIGCLGGLRSVDKDQLNLLKAMGASRWQQFRFAKFPQSLTSFFASLKISVSYAIVGAVIAEWLGGNDGLGVYMTRVRKVFAFDKMFAVIVVISVLSLLMMALVNFIEKRAQPWKEKE
ncbi:ABC transporter permease [Erysipelothrix sp. HDW6C]|uniref:ABC transporter permease n=1 Tax=Erysipelothrix sp. HDW6C TaxID=2714930 RepID=UPI0014094644|nr:ABC transporter permease [Erysipelothrix sp. HDW6C]QIK69511.1 ABC transporter permease [Erysipelothrix sp. HDW6C]